MMRLAITLTFLSFFSICLSGQSKSGFIISANYGVGNLINGENFPRVEQEISSIRFQLDYSLVKWDHTILRLGSGYQILKCRDSSIGYMQFPIVFQRFIRSQKSGFNTSLALLPSYSFGENLKLCNHSNIVGFNLELAVRVGTVFNNNKNKYSVELELAGPMGSMRKVDVLKYIVYGLKFGYYL